MVWGHIAEHRHAESTHVAIMQAVLSDPALLAEYNARTDSLISEYSRKIRQGNAYLASIPEKAFNTNLMLIFDLLEATVHRHQFIRPLFASEDELIGFLTAAILKLILSAA